MPSWHCVCPHLPHLGDLLGSGKEERGKAVPSQASLALGVGHLGLKLAQDPGRGHLCYRDASNDGLLEAEQLQ